MSGHLTRRTEDKFAECSILVPQYASTSGLSGFGLQADADLVGCQVGTGGIGDQGEVVGYHRVEPCGATGRTRVLACG